MKKKSVTLLSTLALIFLAVLSACSTQSQNQSDGKTVIKVATDSDTAPFTYKAIFKDSKDYQVEFVTTPFDSILTGIDAGRYQIAANDFNYNEQRAQKYLFSNPISRSNAAIVSQKGTQYSSLDDLSGKSTEVISGTNYAQILEKWNTDHPDKTPIQINYVSSSTGVTTRVQRVENGKIDFILYDAISAEYIAKDQGFDVTVTKLSDQVGDKTDGLEYLVFADTKEGKELQSFVNKRLKTLKKDGTLASLSETYFGGDYVSGLD